MIPVRNSTHKKDRCNSPMGKEGHPLNNRKGQFYTRTRKCNCKWKRQYTPLPSNKKTYNSPSRWDVLVFFFTEKHSERMLRSFYGGPLPLRGVSGGMGNPTSPPPPNLWNLVLDFSRGLLGPSRTTFWTPLNFFFSTSEHSRSPLGPDFYRFWDRSSLKQRFGAHLEAIWDPLGT